MSEPPTDAQLAKSAAWLACEHNWISSHQADFPEGIYWVSRCSQCGHYWGADLAEQLAAVRADERAKVLADVEAAIYDLAPLYAIDAVRAIGTKP